MLVPCHLHCRWFGNLLCGADTRRQCCPRHGHCCTMGHCGQREQRCAAGAGGDLSFPCIGDTCCSPQAGGEEMRCSTGQHNHFQGDLKAAPCHGARCHGLTGREKFSSQGWLRDKETSSGNT